MSLIERAAGMSKKEKKKKNEVKSSGADFAPLGVGDLSNQDLVSQSSGSQISTSQATQGSSENADGGDALNTGQLLDEIVDNKDRHWASQCFCWHR